MSSDDDMELGNYFGMGRDDFDPDEAGGGGGGGGDWTLDDPFQIDRFYMGSDHIGLDNPKLVYVVDDDETPIAHIHRFPIDGYWRGRLPCPRKAGYAKGCYLCDRADDEVDGQAGWPSYRQHYTIVDLTGWTSDGDRHTEIRALEATEEVNFEFDRVEKELGTVAGTVWEVHRTGDDKVAVGNKWEQIDHVPVGEFLDKEQNLNRLRGSLDRLPEEWGFYEGDGDDRTYEIKPLPWEDILLEALMEHDEQVRYLADKGDQAAKAYAAQHGIALDDDDDASEDGSDAADFYGGNEGGSGGDATDEPMF